MYPIQYDNPVYRPPSEGRSLLLQVTLGCSNNKCTYCAMYRTKQYRVREWEEVRADIDALKPHLSQGWANNRVFLCDGDALGAPFDFLCQVIDYLQLQFPFVRRLGIYATAENILEKTDEQLQMLAEKGLRIGYLGMESGCDKVLKSVVKGNSSEEMSRAGRKLRRNGWKISVIGMLGLGGRKLSSSHTSETARVISEISPEYFSLLTTVAIPGTPYHRMVEKGLCEPLTTRELLKEMKEILQGIETNEWILFRSNHVSNMFPLAGTLCKDKEALIQTLEDWLSRCPEGVYPDLDPHNM